MQYLGCGGEGYIRCGAHYLRTKLKLQGSDGASAACSLALLYMFMSAMHMPCLSLRSDDCLRLLTGAGVCGTSEDEGQVKKESWGGTPHY